MTENQMRAAARDEGVDVARHAGEAAGQVGSTVADQAAHVRRETAEQARHVVRDVRERVAAEAEEQAVRVSKQLGRIADELGEMAGAAPPSSMSAGAIRSVADTSRQAARFLDERGAQGLLDSARDYARRKPGTFLLGAAVAGFLVGRIAKSATGSQDEGRQRSQGGVVPVASERAGVAPEYGAPAQYDQPTPAYGTPLSPGAAAAPEVSHDGP
ncbi:hypothetical protein [Lentzea flava]|uniref:DUF3618 domain-containing protein n=1 Tax=Lentzea flava TaxID=103732 RepID=A0ABQ2UBD0_9PSEU|nr:hypothetical protein [Lentzea flava]MCP2196531.1 hypothetical protein [Lentzea flava]GGU17311.1 hypothetical protein GCM10010178_06430 [Lentzea flava]